MKLAISLSAAAFGLVLALFWFVPYGHADERVCGEASWYAYTGHRTASGELFDGSGLTAASPTLPLGTTLRVWRGNRSVVVRVNDRGPYAYSRILDLSRAAAEALGMIHIGHAPICYERVG